jgi:hypothetical protein
MCCDTGVCGPSINPLLAAFAADVQWLTAQGVAVTRHNLAQDPQAFLDQPVVKALLEDEGDACLPLVLVDGVVVGHGAYPRRDELAEHAGLVATASRTKPIIRLSTQGGGCTPGSGCC